MSPGEATALLIIPALVTNIWQGWAGPSFGALLRRLWPTMVGDLRRHVDRDRARPRASSRPEAASIARKASAPR